jgi:DegV family protein with EDD domain
MPGARDRVAVVTDSTAYLPADVVERQALTVVPLQVVVGGRSLAEGVEVTSDEVARALQEWRPVTTSRPSPQTFAETYRSLGVPEIVSVHLSSDLSGTADAARLAARQVADEGIAVTVVDSRSLGMGLGFVAVAAARAALDGAPADAVARVARRLAPEVAIWLYVDTLEYLRRGGRIGGAAAWIGSALDIKPILTVESEIKAVERVRTRRRGLDRLVELMRQRRSLGADRWFVQHAQAHEDAEAMVERLTELFGRPPEFVSEVGPVIGTHTGPGAIWVGGLPGAALR